VLAWTGDEIHRIPRALITGCSRAQLEVLMQSLLEGDGTAKGDAWTTFYAGMNEGLADDFQEIALRLGMSVSKKRVPQNGQWTIRISRRRHHYIRRTGSAAYAGTVWCVTLPSGAFVARRHGKVFVTGNCPQKGDVESKKAVIDLLTRGRKRGLIGALATQRLAKLDKDVAAECNVKLIGLCNLPADRGRAVEELGFDKEEERDKRKVFGKIKTGHFFASGPGIDAEDGIVELKVGTVETTHPEPGASDIGVTPPTARIRKALAKLGDLPKEAAAELKTVRELQARVKELEARGPKIVEVEQKVYPAIKTVDKLVLKEGDFAKLNALIARLEKVQARSVLAGEQIQSALLSVRTALGKVNPHVPTVDRPAPSPVPRRAQDPNLRLYRGGPIPSTTTRTLDPKPAAPGSPRGEELDLPVGQAATLDALIQFTAGLDRVKLSVLTGYKRSTRDAYIARLEKAGLVTVGPGTRVTATQAGHDARPNAQPLPVGKDLQVFWLSRLPHGEAAIFKILLAAGGDTVAHVAIDEETGFKRSTRDAYLSRMEAKQIVVRAPGVAAASPNLF
jgi:hypothetical protein